MFFRGSRYEQVAVATFTMPDGRSVSYKRMRFVPESGGSILYKVRQGDRTDLAAYNALGDPEQFWRLCDANTVQRPVDLTAEPGAKIQVPGPDIR
jgi:hypothetical protein